MRDRLKIILGAAGSWIPQRLLVRLTGQDLILPYYHAVSNAPMPHVAHVYPVRTVRQFKGDLDSLLKHYEPVGLEGLLSHSPGKRSKPAMFLSFDDGLSEIYRIVSPILIAKGIPAAIFLNTDFLDNRDLFYRYKISLILDRLERTGYSKGVTERMQSLYDLTGTGRRPVREFILDLSYRDRKELDEIAGLVDLDFSTFLKVRKPYMSLQQVKELANQGFYIGAHSKDHPVFTEIDPGDRLIQYRESMAYIQKELDTGYGIFSFPFSDHGVPGEFFELIRAGGMPRLDASFGTAGLKRDPVPFHYQRIQMETGKAPARQLVRGEYLYYLTKGLAGKNLVKRK
jgi:peptidoglycan/xylan/chitin deacetylase (PgdA/CDA1 family)